MDLLCCSTLLLASLFPVADDREKAETLVKEAREALARGNADDALTNLNEALKLDPKNARAHLLRGGVHDALDRHADAVKDYTRVLELEPNNADALDRRGSANFKAGRVAESAADFDAYLKLRPADFNGHWRRGISLYYAGRFDDGRKQFEGYENVDTNDVENAVWHFLCVARKDGVEKARKSVLKIGRDRRVPMMVVYDLFRGAAKPEDVLKACDEDKPDAAQKGYRLFYAHLYLGLYAEVNGDAKRALEHLELSVKQPKVHPYMWDVARVHRDLLKNKK
jgi:lipoprotein NlpI